MTEVFATKIPLEATFFDIIKAIEPLGKLMHITIRPTKEFQSAFLQYETEEEAQKVLETVGAKNGKLVSEQMMNENIVKILDEPIVIEQFVQKKEILDRREKKDKQHLSLLYEGHIKATDKAAEGLTPQEISKRKKVFEEMQKKLEDVNNSIIPTRLCIMNVPEGVTERNIKNIFAVASKKYSRNHKKFPECKEAFKSTVHITDVRKVEGQKGLFFVEFSKHEHALCALRQTNNNPNINGFNGQRMIVHFAIANSFKTHERKKKLEAKKNQREMELKKREERSKIQYGFPTTQDSDSETD